VVHVTDTINVRTQEMVNHIASQNRCLHTTTLIWEKHFYSAQSVASLTHH